MSGVTHYEASDCLRKAGRFSQPIDFSDLLQTFESLDRKASHTVLRPSQYEAATELSRKKDERDVVLKISTGAGKTTVGLLYLYSKMKENNSPAVFLCPTVQLVTQTIREAENLGVPAVHYARGETYPGPDGASGNAIIICTYDKLFNGKSTFNRQDVLLRPCALVLDDAHSGLEVIKKSFCLSLKEEHRTEFLKILSNQCLDFKRSTWLDILASDPEARMEVPFWIWKSLVGEISDFLLAHKDKYEFSWPNISDRLHLCRCIVSGRNIEITPILPFVEKHPAFSEAKHRLFMSATLADDSLLVSELGLSKGAARSPISPPSDKGLGERMVLAPSLIDKNLDRSRVMEICRDLSSQVNVVVLSPSEQRAREWEPSGAKVFLTDGIESGVSQLRDHSSGLKFAVFIQRYDGVDLPDDACRILVIDGMPLGENLTDSYDSSLIASPGGARRKVIYRIEQGMGRAVRSHVDYAVVLLVGDEVANFIAKKDVRTSMNEDTAIQLSLALELSKMLSGSKLEEPKSVLVKTINQCLSRDDGWKQFYKQRVRDKVSKLAYVDSGRIEFAEIQRKAFSLAQANAFSDAARVFEEAIDMHIKDEKEKAIYLQELAAIYNQYDGAKALQVQQGAFMKNTLLNCPPAMVRKPLVLGKASAGEIFCRWFKEFENPNGALSALLDIRSRLDYEKSFHVIESALLDLAPLVGAEAWRPEEEVGEGPDCLWLWADMALVIEAKNQNEKTLHKKDAGQLLISMQWFNRTYPTRDRAFPVVAAKTSTPDRYTDYPDQTLVIIQDKINEICSAVEALLMKLIEQGPLFATPQNVEGLLRQYKLTSDDFCSTFCVQLNRKKG